MTNLSKNRFYPEISKNTIIDGGSTTLYAVFTADTVDTVYTIQTALYCLNSSMCAYMYYLQKLEYHWTRLL